jgi:hypothetical protein
MDLSYLRLPLIALFALAAGFVAWVLWRRSGWRTRLARSRERRLAQRLYINSESSDEARETLEGGAGLSDTATHRVLEQVNAIAKDQSEGRR